MNSVLALSGPGLRAACIGLAMAIALSAGVRAAAFDDPADLAAIRAAEEALEGGASGGALAQYYTQDAIRLDSVAPGQQRGRTQIAAALGQQAGAPVSHHLLESSIVSDGRMACDALEMQIVRKAQDGSQRQEEWRRLDVFTKLDGHWLIAQEHISGPADRSTGAILRAGPLQVRGPAQWPAVMFADPALQPQAAKAALRHWVKAALSVIGIGPAMGFFDPTGNVLLYGEFAPGNVRGSSEIHDYYAGIMGSYTTIDVVTPVLEVASDGTLGAQIDTQDLVLHLNDRTTRPISIRQSDCLRRAGRRWFSFMEMVSFPMDKETGQAVMQSRPTVR
jgi:ketosteroid isomerase-like protein